MTFAEFAAMTPDERIRYQHTTNLINAGIGFCAGVAMTVIIALALILTLIG